MKVGPSIHVARAVRRLSGPAFTVACGASLVALEGGLSSGILVAIRSRGQSSLRLNSIHVMRKVRRALCWIETTFAASNTLVLRECGPEPQCYFARLCYGVGNCFGASWCEVRTGPVVSHKGRFA